MVLPALGFMLGVACAEWWGPLPAVSRAAVVWGPFILLVALWGAWRRRLPSGYAAGLLVALAVFVGAQRMQMATARPADSIGAAVADGPLLARVVGEIVTAPIERDGELRNAFIPYKPPARTTFRVQVERVQTGDRFQSASGVLQVGVDGRDLGLCAGQRVELTGTLYPPLPPANLGETDWSRWYRYAGVDAGLSVPEAADVRVVTQVHGRWGTVVQRLRAVARGLLVGGDVPLPNEARRLLDVMVLGQRSAADRALNDAFARAGAMHFLAISGFHVGVLALATAWGVRVVLRRGRKLAALGALAVVLVYALLVEPNAPVIRATIIVACATAAVLLNRPLRTLNWVAFAALVILCINPLELFRAGFQLSFLIVAALLVCARRFERFFLPRWSSDGEPPPEPKTWCGLLWLRTRRYIVALAVVCVLAWVVSLPLMLLHFGRCAPWGWLGSLLLMPLAVLAITLSFATLALRLLIPPVGGVCTVVLGWMTQALLGVVALFDHLPGALIETSSPPVWLVLGSYVLAGGIWWLTRRQAADAAAHATSPPMVGRRPRHALGVRKLAAVVAVFLVICGWGEWLIIGTTARGPGVAVHVLAVGNGSANILTTPGNAAAVIDAGTDTNHDVGDTLASALRALRTGPLRCVLISHANYDHFSGLPTLLRQFRPAAWQTNVVDAAVGSHFRATLSPHLPTQLPSLTPLVAGDCFAVDAAHVEVLWPPAALDPATETNDRSLVVRVSAAGRSVLLMGDCEKLALAGLLERAAQGDVDLHADVLVAPHHGQVIRDVTAELLRAVAPRAVIVSTRTPRPRLAAQVRQTLGPDVAVWETGVRGAVTVRLLPDGALRLEAYRGAVIAFAAKKRGPLQAHRDGV